ncbi:radical SAM/SPASM domain-containing protein [Pseudoalteromonas sp. SR41-4]|uniref:radical SAM protein n=1 Tax=Pseudoalteromonas sp. SR41-4 TaxID=2760950 RepID=UPI001C7272AA|nr:radical SAM/SPASM domain-containing protein [Pseudoalteromonas sp. SR41-4]
MRETDFWRITLDTNPDTCNLNCVMCEDHSPYSDSPKLRKQQGRLRPNMDRVMLEQVIRDAAAMGIKEVIPSTMGEPLLYPHFDVFLDLCHELGLSLNLTTNGTFPSPDKHHNVEYWANRIVPIGSDVKISWNGATDATHSNIMLGAQLSEHIENAKRFIAVRDSWAERHYCSITMQLTFLRSNLEEIPQMVDLAIALGFDRIKGHQLWAHFDEIATENLRNDIVFAERWNQIVKYCHERVELHNKTAIRPFKLDNFSELHIDNLDDIAPNGHCPFLGKEIWIDPSGRFNVCCAPDQERKSLGEFGSVAESSLSELAQSEQYVELMNTYQDHPLCKQCTMRRV